MRWILGVALLCAACGDDGSSGDACDGLTSSVDGECVARDGVTVRVANAIFVDTTGGALETSVVEACFLQATAAPRIDPEELISEGGCTAYRQGQSSTQWLSWDQPEAGTITVGGGTLAATELVESTDPGCYFVDVDDDGPFDGGETFTASSTGGADFAAFDLEAQAPDLVRGADVPVDLVPGEPYTMTFSGEGEVILNFIGDEDISISCGTRSGSVTIPGSVTAEAPSGVILAFALIGRLENARVDRQDGVAELWIGSIYQRQLNVAAP